MDDYRAHLHRGIAADLLDRTGTIDDYTWCTRAAAQIAVGTCRQPRGAHTCQGTLRALPPYTIGRTRWYDAGCTTCGARVTSPGGRTLHRSGRHSEQDQAVMHRRREAWAQHTAYANGETA